jgi:hypothetical protein
MDLREECLNVPHITTEDFPAVQRSGLGYNSGETWIRNM